MEPEIVLSRKVRLEELNRISNTSFDYLKRLYDGHPISELYRRSKIELHIHYAMNGMFCATYTAIDPIKGRMTTEKPCRVNLACDASEIPVFVPIGKVAENFRPLASLVRLKLLDLCDMCGVDALEPSGLASRETVFSAFHRELRHVLRCPEIKPGKVEDEIVHGASEIVTNLPDENANPHFGSGPIAWHTHLEFMRGLRVELTNNSVLLLPHVGGDLGFKIHNVFFCPPNPLKRRLDGGVGLHDSLFAMANEIDAKEVEKRREAILKKMLATPPKPFTPKAKKKPSPTKGKAKKAK